MTTCVLCKDEVDSESPFMTGGVYEVNPYTFRRAWMHGYCLIDAADAARSIPATNPDFDSRYDQWLHIDQSDRQLYPR